MKKKHFSIISGAWCLVTLFGFANFLAFYYAGYKSKSRKYIFIGHMYLVLKLAPAIIKTDFFSSLISFLSIVGYFFGIVFAFVTIKAFYKRLKLLDLIDPLILNSKIKLIYTLDNQALEKFVNENEYFFEQKESFSNSTNRDNSYSQPYISKADVNDTSPERNDNNIDITVNIINEHENKREIHRVNVDNIDLEDLIDITDITKEIIKKAVTDIEKEIKYTFEDSENMVTFSSKTKMKKKK